MSRKKNKTAKQRRASRARSRAAGAENKNPANMNQVKQPQPKAAQGNSSTAKNTVRCKDCDEVLPRPHHCSETCMRCNIRFKIKDAPRHECMVIPCCGCCQREVAHQNRPAPTAANAPAVHGNLAFRGPNPNPTAPKASAPKASAPKPPAPKHSVPKQSGPKHSAPEASASKAEKKKKKKARKQKHKSIEA
ncbi:hypothetical protein N7528_004884 [Penicillium herquei]|nr:hypothetical protein N7528_004884 [Penicillium herquei]